MDLALDTAITHQDLECTFVAPVVVPGIDTEPVVFSALGSPADNLDSMTTLSGTSHVLVHTGLVRQEVHVDGEGSSNSTVGHDFHLDVINTRDSVG